MNDKDLMDHPVYFSYAICLCYSCLRVGLHFVTIRRFAVYQMLILQDECSVQLQLNYHYCTTCDITVQPGVIQEKLADQRKVESNSSTAF